MDWSKYFTWVLQALIVGVIVVPALLGFLGVGIGWLLRGARAGWRMGSREKDQ